MSSPWTTGAACVSSAIGPLLPDGHAGADGHLGDARGGGLLAADEPRHQRVGRQGRRRGAQRSARAQQQQLAQRLVAHAQLGRDVGVCAVGHGDRDERGALAIVR
jgi:hypothetical protein